MRVNLLTFLFVGIFITIAECQRGNMVRLIKVIYENCLMYSTTYKKYVFRVNDLLLKVVSKTLTKIHLACLIFVDCGQNF